MARRIVGVDLGTQSINTVQVGFGSSKKATIENYLEFVNFRGVDESGQVTDVETVAASLKQLWLIAGYKTKHVALGLGNAQIFVREFTIPLMPRQNIRQALPRLAEGVLPLPSSELILDFYPIREKVVETETVVEGLLVAANKAGVENLVAAAEMAGLVVKSIDLTPFAVTRYFMTGQKREGTGALIYAGGGLITIVIAVNGVPQFIRIIPITEPQQIQRPADSLSPQNTDEESSSADGLSMGETEKSESPETLESQLITPPLFRIATMLSEEESRSRVIREIKDTLSYFNLSHPEIPIDRVELAGYSLNEKSFVSDLENAITVPLESILKSALGHKKDLAALVGNYETADELVVALALAQGGFE